MDRSAPTVIELFCGAGGTSRGFQDAGYDVRLGLDFDPAALATFRRNHPNAVALEQSIETATAAQIMRAAKLSSVDVVIGGPSCQGYSTIGKRVEQDSRNYLYTHYLRIVKEISPRWLVFENVRGMAYYSKGRFLRDLCEELKSAGYQVVHGVLNAADFGVPQRRERLVVIATREPLTPTLPSPTHEDPRCGLCTRPDASNKKPGSRAAQPLFGALPCPNCNDTGREPVLRGARKPWTTLWEAIGDLPSLGECGGADGFVPYSVEAFSDYQVRMRADATGYTLHSARPVSKLAKSIICRVPEGKGIRAVPEHELPERFRIMRRINNGALRRDCTTLYYRLERDLPSYTITCYFANVSSGAFTHPLVDRAITIREAARLQSFPDAFEFAPTNVRRQIGNAVPPMLAEAIGRHIQAMADRPTGSTSSDGRASHRKGQRRLVAAE